MDIQNNKIYINKTWKYLFPSLKLYDPTLSQNLATFIKLAVGVQDSSLEPIDTNCIFILLQTNCFSTDTLYNITYKERFSIFLNWVRTETYFVKDYLYYDKNIVGKHMFVLKLPISNTSYSNFLSGNYSKMYKENQLDKMYIPISNKTNLQEIVNRNLEIDTNKNVLLKHKVLLSEFVKTVNKTYNTTVTEKDLEESELDFPMVLSEEIFNY